jgi:hypothetical protein
MQLTEVVCDGVVYRIERVQRRTRNGVVYLALHSERQCNVEITLFDESAREQALDAARGRAGLFHPNLVLIVTVGVHNDLVFLVHTFRAGRTAEEWLADTPRTARQVLDVYLAAARGLAAAHQGGVVHRDFGADRIRVGYDGQVEVTDLAGPAISTLELAEDQRAFAVALDEALSQLAPSKEVTAALARALSPEPAARFPSMDALIAALAPRRWWQLGCWSRNR